MSEFKYFLEQSSATKMMYQLYMNNTAEEKDYNTEDEVWKYISCIKIVKSSYENLEP